MENKEEFEGKKKSCKRKRKALRVYLIATLKKRYLNPQASGVTEIS